MSKKELIIAGITKMSTSDWPGHISMVIFLQGCPWNCEYCHNPDMIPFNVPSKFNWEKDIITHLKKRIGLLDSVVFSGGEATSQNLEPYIKRVKNMGFKVGLHTNGANYKNLEKIIKLLDWIGLDIKALPKDIDKITKKNGSSIQTLKSLDCIIKSGIDFETRTTYGPGIFNKEYADNIKKFLKEKGIENHVLQDVRPDGARKAFINKYNNEL